MGFQLVAGVLADRFGPRPMILGGVVLLAGASMLAATIQAPWQLYLYTGVLSALGLVALGWGIGDQEMCVVALQADTGLAFEGDVKAGTGAQLGVAPDGEIQYGGPCDLLAFPWDFEKPGGTGH